MRVLVCGGRDFTDKVMLERELDILNKLHGPFTVVIEGEQRGADILARRWAEARGIAVQPYPANWSYGPVAGSMRNARMLRQGKPDMVVAFSGGKGTQNMMAQALVAGIKVVKIEKPGPDEDGDCTRCGLRWQEPDSTEPHVCPPGFTS